MHVYLDEIEVCSGELSLQPILRVRSGEIGSNRTAGGGYSTVDLVQHGNSGNTYALKSVSKGYLDATCSVVLKSEEACQDFKISRNWP